VQSLKIGAYKPTVHNGQTCALNYGAQTNKIKTAPKTDQGKTDAKTNADSNEISAIKKRLHKAKRTLEDIKQWTSLKKFSGKRNQNLEKVYCGKNSGTSSPGSII
jgi:hypothetical protein